MEVGGLLGEDDLLHQVGGAAYPADAKAGGNGFREGAAVEDARGLDAAAADDVEREAGGDGIAAEAEGRVGGVLDERDVEGVDEVEEALSAGLGERLAGGVGEVGHGVGAGDASAGVAGVGGVGCRGHVAVEVEAVVAGLVGVEGLERAEVGWGR